MGLDTLLNPRLCEMGKIKIGGKESKVRTSAGGASWRAPEKHDYFTITTLNRASNGDLIPDETLMRQLMDSYGDGDGKLRQLPITLLSDDPEEIIQSAWVCYHGKRIIARSDGTTCEWFFDRTTRKFLDTPKVEPWTPAHADLKDAKNNRMFKLHTTFNCVVTTNDARWGGVYKFRTTSRISADQIYGSLIHLKDLTRGILAGLPLRMVVRPIQVSPEGKTTTVYVVHVEMRGEDLQHIRQLAGQILEDQVRNAVRIEANKVSYRKLLAAPGHEIDPNDIRDIADEFHATEPPPNAKTVLDDIIGDGKPEIVDTQTAIEPDGAEYEPDDADVATMTAPARELPAHVAAVVAKYAQQQNIDPIVAESYLAGHDVVRGMKCDDIYSVTEEQASRLSMLIERGEL
jgi:hypothetical protein